jgi:hypothetical protein
MAALPVDAKQNIAADSNASSNDFFLGDRTLTLIDPTTLELPLTNKNLETYRPEIECP